MAYSPPTIFQTAPCHSSRHHWLGYTSCRAVPRKREREITHKIIHAIFFHYYMTSFSSPFLSSFLLSLFPLHPSSPCYLLHSLMNQALSPCFPPSLHSPISSPSLSLCSLSVLLSYRTIILPLGRSTSQESCLHWTCNTYHLSDSVTVQNLHSAMEWRHVFQVSLGEVLPSCNDGEHTLQVRLWLRRMLRAARSL